MDAVEPAGRLLRRLRHAAGDSQYTLASRLVAMSGNSGLTREQIARWERGKRIPGPYWRYWLSRAFDVPQMVLDGAASYAWRVRRMQRA